jgi:predicted small lipoprotein YifL
MSEDNVLTRREFTIESALAMLATVAITITGCGDDSPPAAPTPVDRTGAVSTDNNHTHPSVTITSLSSRPETRSH